MSIGTFKELFSKLENNPVYWVESAKLKFTEELCRILSIEGISRADFAQRIGSHRSYVTKILRGNVNFTLESMVRLTRALNAEIEFKIVPKNRNVSMWQENYKNMVLFKPVKNDMGKKVFSLKQMATSTTLEKTSEGTRRTIDDTLASAA